mgnify:CR=1 FL=1
MKGHVKLELRNANGETKVVHQDNLITNAVLMNIANSVMLNTSGEASSIYDVFANLRNALGGILLFDDNLPEDKNNISFPTDCNLLGIGSNTNPSPYGNLATFVSSESKYDKNGIKMVWDFNTSQGNGVIKSIALTNKEAYLNICDSYNDSYSGLTYISTAWPVLKSNDVGSTIPFYFIDDSCYVWSAYDKCIYMINSNLDGSIKPYKRYNSTLVKELNIDNVLDITNGFDGYIYMLRNNPPSIKRYKLSDLSFDEDTNFQMNINIENTLYYNSRYARIIICDGMAYIFYHSDCYYKINLETMEQGKIQLPSTINGISLISENHVYFLYYSDSSPYQVYKLDLKTGVILKTCILTPSKFEKAMCKRLNKSGLSLITYTRNGTTTLYVGMSKNYLGTICNLKTPIEKTADQTLRVTYTLTDVNT